MNVYIRRTSNESQVITPEWVYDLFFFFCQHKFQDICRQKESFLPHNYEHSTFPAVPALAKNSHF